MRENLKLLSLDNNLEKQKLNKTADLIQGGLEGLREYRKFISGKNDLQEWIENNRLLRGRVFSYEDANIEMMLGKKDKKLEKAPRPYLKQYINDQCKDKTVIKSRQSEFTENEINENIWLSATIPYLNVRHVFPTAGMAQQIAKEKISPAIHSSPNIFKLIKRPYNITSKEFQNGSFYTVDSSWTDHGGRGPSSDKITFDEYESQNPQIEEIYSESTSHSALNRRTRISTPLMPNSGIDEKYQKGCMYEWNIVCPKCKKQQRMEFPENIIGFFEANRNQTDIENYLKKLDKVYIGCKYCAAYIDKTSTYYLITSRWIPNKKYLIDIKASYRVTYFMLPWKTGKEILFKYHSFRFVHQFWNEVAGFAYVDPSSQIDRSLFERCIDNSFKNSYRNMGMARNVSVGVDWGMTSWVVVRANGFPPNIKYPRVIYTERIDEKSLKKFGYPEAKQTDHVKRVCDIVNFFKAKVIVNDANGIGVDRNSYLVQRFPTKAWGCFYDTDEIQRQKKKENLIKPRFVEKSRIITVSRVGTFKMLVQEYEEERVKIPQLDPNTEEFIQHHANIAIQFMADEKTGAIFEIVGKTGPSHFAHSDNYSKIGFDSFVNTIRAQTVGVIDSTKKKDYVDIDSMLNPDLI